MIFTERMVWGVILLVTTMPGVLVLAWMAIRVKPSPGFRYVPTAANIANYNRVRACRRCVNPRTGRQSIVPM